MLRLNLLLQPKDGGWQIQGIPHFLTKVIVGYLRSCSTRMGDRAFSFVAPTIWNPLPFEVRSAGTVNVFKAHLKTHIFSLRNSGFL